MSEFGFQPGVRGRYTHSKALSPFFQGRTVNSPPAQWSVPPELRAALFAGLKPWLVEWPRKFLVGKDPKGNELWDTKLHYFIRCSRCKQQENWEHFIEHESGLIGPFCRVCVRITIDQSLTDVAGQVADAPVYYLQTTERNLARFLAAVQGAADPETANVAHEKVTDLF